MNNHEQAAALVRRIENLERSNRVLEGQLDDALEKPLQESKEVRKHFGRLEDNIRVLERENERLNQEVEALTQENKQLQVRRRETAFDAMERREAEAKLLVQQEASKNEAYADELHTQSTALWELSNQMDNMLLPVFDELESLSKELPNLWKNGENLECATKETNCRILIMQTLIEKQREVVEEWDIPISTPLSDTVKTEFENDIEYLDNGSVVYSEHDVDSEETPLEMLFDGFAYSESDEM